MIELKKPRHGQPCNGCGLCCMQTVCPFGRIVLKPTHPDSRCRALEASDDGSRYQCGLVAHPKRYLPTQPGDEEKLGKAALVLIGGNFVCDSQATGERRHPNFDAMMRRAYRTTQPLIDPALAVWGLGAGRLWIDVGI